jgi:hypothetical protein
MTSDNSIESPAFAVDSLSVRHFRPRLGRILAGAAIATVLGAFTLNAFLRGLLPDASLPARILSAISSMSYYAAPALALASVLVTSRSIPFPAAASVEASARGLRFQELDVSTGGRRLETNGRSRWIPRERIASGIVVPTEVRPSLDIYLRNGDRLVITLQSENQARQILSALGIDASRRAVALTLGSPSRPLIAGCITFPLVTLALALLLLSLPVPDALFIPATAMSVTIIMLLILSPFRPREVIIGTDGVTIGGAWRTRFIPCSLIEDVYKRSSIVALKLKGGKQIVIKPQDDELQRAIYNRIREAIQSKFEQDPEALPDLEQLEPRGLDLSAWRASLRALSLPRDDYRRAAVPSDVLIAVVEDANAPPGRRIGAALALGSSGHPGARETIRSAAEACASQGVRVALERAAEDDLDDAALERALEEAAEAEAADPRARR